MLDADGVQRIVDRIVEERAIARTVTAPPGLEAVRRVRQDGTGILFLLNHRPDDVTLSAAGTDLLDGSGHGPETVVPAGGVRVLLEAATA
jgi:beta-galactosidase